MMASARVFVETLQRLVCQRMLSVRYCQETERHIAQPEAG